MLTKAEWAEIQDDFKATIIELIAEDLPVPESAWGYLIKDDQFMYRPGRGGLVGFYRGHPVIIKDD